MIMSNIYLQHYRTLGAQPGCSWRELRGAYRRLVKTWHPDRYERQDNKQDKGIAENRIKDINKAYRSLSDYYKKHGNLPPAYEEATLHDPWETPDFTTEHSPGAEAGVAKTKSPGRLHPLRLILVGMLIGSGYVAWVSYTRDNSQAPSPPAGTQPPAVPAAAMTAAPGQQWKEIEARYFTIGSTIGEVYAIQGIPTKTDDTVWYYGESRVYFHNGTVARWEDSPETPLRASFIPEAPRSNAKFFSKGSTKSEVKSAQGAPLYESERVWDYGLSKVYFEYGRVSGWQESPMKPLKIHKQ
jgi:hypothetical protein